MEKVKIEEWLKGYGSGSGYKIKLYKESPVYYVDNIPCIFIAIHGPVASVLVIDPLWFTDEQKYIYKFNGMFAHGDTIEKAKSDAERKYYSTLDTEEAIDKFIEMFPGDQEYPNQLFYQWHTVLTGSCDSGKDMFMKSVGAKMDDSMTVRQFVNLTRNAYGGEIIKQLEKRLVKP